VENISTLFNNNGLVVLSSWSSTSRVELLSKEQMYLVSVFVTVRNYIIIEKKNNRSNSNYLVFWISRWTITSLL